MNKRRRALRREAAWLAALSFTMLAASPPVLAQPGLARAGVVVNEAAPPRAGEICLACGRPVGIGDAALLYRGRRIVLHRAGCLDAWNSNPERLFAKEQPRGALFQEHEAHAPRILSAWFLLGLYVVLGLVAGAACAYGAVTRGLSPFRWFLGGLALNVVAIALLLGRRRRDLSQLPGGVPRGLAKVPLTRPPAHCPVCGSLNHPSAPRCLTCGTLLEPTAVSELLPS